MGRRKDNEKYEDLGIDTAGMKSFTSNLRAVNLPRADQREFMFGLCLSLGHASNNYAEYCGLILAQLIFSMFK